jgi:hypothetical protein
MRSYYKVYALSDQSAIADQPDPGFDADNPFYIQVGLRSRDTDFIDAYNFLSSVASAQTGGAFTPVWKTFDSNAVQTNQFSGQQLAGFIFSLRAYSGHPLN